MQQLYLIIKQRYANLKKIQAASHNPNSELLREMRDEQKLRVEKQSWILSMFRAKKNKMTLELKKTYYRYSCQIMKIIEPDLSNNNAFFKKDKDQENDLNALTQNQQNFLNTFVCLYTKFFQQYEQKLSFKLKIKSLLRPTNHNVINDLIKYLVEFSRDYCQYLIFMKIKGNEREKDKQRQRNKQKMIQQQIQIKMKQEKQSLVNKNNAVIFQGSRNSFNGTGLTKCIKEQNKAKNMVQPSKKGQTSAISTQIITPYLGDDEGNVPSSQISASLKKNEFQKLYGALEIQSFSNFVFMEKNKNNIDVVKLKMNEMYRDIKFRNNFIKQSLLEYYRQYFPSSSSTQFSKQSILEDTSLISFPFKISLVVQKNGFSCLNLCLYNEKIDRNLSPLKDNKNRSTSFSQREGANVSNNHRTPVKNQFLLNSLKVLRVSQTMLPPIECNTEQRSEIINSFGKKASTMNIHLDNIDLLKSNDRISSIASNMDKKLIRLQRIEDKPQMSKIMTQSNKNIDLNDKNGAIYYSYNNSYNQEIARQMERKKMQRKKLSDMRRHFTSQDKMKNLKKRANDPEQKIVEWLDKINLMKQLERKKIMGLG